MSPFLSFRFARTDTSTATDAAQEKNAEFRRLVHLNNLLSALCNLYITVGFAHGKVASSFLQALGASSGSTFLPDLGQLHRACIWENILLKMKIASSKITKEAEKKAADATSTEGIFSPVIERSELGAALLDASTDAPKQAVEEPNFNAIKAIAHSIPAMLTPFFQGASLCASRDLADEIIRGHQNALIPPSRAFAQAASCSHSQHAGFDAQGVPRSNAQTQG